MHLVDLLFNAEERAAYGFLGGREIQEAGVGNLGLHDRELPQLLVVFKNTAQPMFSSHRKRSITLGSTAYRVFRR